MNNLNEFCTKTVGVIAEQLNYEYEVELQEFFKINTRYMGLIIRKEGINISPSINMNCLYEDYLNGISYSEIISKIHTIYNQTKVTDNMNFDFLKDFDAVKDLIVFRLIGDDNNKEFLKDKPHRKFLDMVLVYYYEFDMDKIQHCSVCVTDNQMKSWNITEQCLYELALKNTAVIHKPYWFDLRDYIMNMMGVEAQNIFADYNEEGRIFVITNAQKNYGAVSIFCSESLKEIAAKVGDNLFVIPSSVHEILAIPERYVPKCQDYNALIRSINLEVLKPEDVLGETLYYYDFELDELQIFKKSI